MSDSSTSLLSNWRTPSGVGISNLISGFKAWVGTRFFRLAVAVDAGLSEKYAGFGSSWSMGSLFQISLKTCHNFNKTFDCSKKGFTSDLVENWMIPLTFPLPTKHVEEHVQERNQDKQMGPGKLSYLSLQSRIQVWLRIRIAFCRPLCRPMTNAAEVKQEPRTCWHQRVTMSLRKVRENVLWLKPWQWNSSGASDTSLLADSHLNCNQYLYRINHNHLFRRNPYKLSTVTGWGTGEHPKLSWHDMSQASWQLKKLISCPSFSGYLSSHDGTSCLFPNFRGLFKESWLILKFKVRCG